MDRPGLRRVLEVFDGKTNVAYRLTVQPEETLNDEADRLASNVKFAQ